MKSSRCDRNIFDDLHKAVLPLSGVGSCNYSMLASLIKTSKLSEKSLENDAFQHPTLELRFYLIAIRDHLKLKNADIAEKANISEAYFKEILNGRKHPKRDTTLGLCFGLELNLDESQILLKKAGFNELYFRDQRDSIIASCIVDEKDLLYTNDLLSAHKLKQIGKYYNL